MRAGPGVSLAIAIIAGAVSAAAERVIPPGQDRLLGRIAGAGVEDLAGCQFESARAEKNRAILRYGCGSEKVTITLHHRDLRLPDIVETTGQFALVTKDAPRSLVASIAARARANESDWRWVEVTPGRRESGAKRRKPPTEVGLLGFIRNPQRYALLILAAAALGFTGSFLWGRRKGRES